MKLKDTGPWQGIQGKIKILPIPSGMALNFTMDCRPYNPEKIYQFFWAWIYRRYPGFKPYTVFHNLTPTTFTVTIVCKEIQPNNVE
jgi:hypothetical protein